MIVDNRKLMRIAGVLGLAVLMPAVARADAGTPLMWLTMLHLVIGNLFIGFFEAVLLILIFKARPVITLFLMIAANYFSAWCGYVMINRWGNALSNFFLGPVPLYHALAYLVGAMIFLILATYVLEWPFCLAIFWKDPRRWRKSVLATLATQTASYAVLLFLYISASPATVLTQTKIERNVDFAANPMLSVYYVGIDDGAIWRKRLDGKPAEKIADTKVMGNEFGLYGKLGDNGKDVDLWLTRADHTPGKRSVMFDERVLGNFARHAGLGNGPIDLRPLNQRDWVCEYGHWPGEWFYAHNDKTGKKLWLGMETPLLTWFSHAGTLIPGNQMIYQLGDMIVLLDLNTRQLAVVAMGRGPVVGWD